MIEILDPESWEEVDRAIINLPGYEGVVFTSQNAVERFLLRINSINKSARHVLALAPDFRDRRQDPHCLGRCRNSGYFDAR